MIHELREGWSEFASRTWLWTIVASFGFFQLTLFPALLVLGPIVAKTQLGGASAWGLILAFQGVGSVLGGLLALRLHPRRPLVMSTLFCLPIAGVLALLGAAAPVAVLCVVGFIAAVGLTAGDIVWFTTFQRKVPDHLMSRLSSFDWFGSVALNPIGYALVGPVANRLGVAETLYFAAAANALVTLVVASTPAIRNLRAPSPVVVQA
jgi:MFS family permease